MKNDDCTAKSDAPILSVEHLNVGFRTRRGSVRAVNDVSFQLYKGKTLGLVGESGSGKSVSSMSILRLLDTGGVIEGGKILFGDEELTQVSDARMREIRGNQISMIFQEPMTALNPVFSVARQLREPFLIHRGMGRSEADTAALEMLRAVQIPDPRAVMRQYPHQLSGGMRQRVMIAMALACRPAVLIADEPTTALDVTVQAQILQLMRELQDARGTSILFITHDLGVIREMADDVAVMYCGQVVEAVTAEMLFTDCPMSHPYTEGLMRSIPRPEDGAHRPIPIEGAVPHPTELPVGCKFSPRCPYATEKCVREEPPLFAVTPTQSIRCFYPRKEERRSEEHKRIVIH